jgi:hypothetical protein
VDVLFEQNGSRITDFRRDRVSGRREARPHRTSSSKATT